MTDGLNKKDSVGEREGREKIREKTTKAEERERKREREKEREREREKESTPLTLLYQADHLLPVPLAHTQSYCRLHHPVGSHCTPRIPGTS